MKITVDYINSFIEKLPKNFKDNHFDNKIIMNIDDFKKLGIGKINDIELIGNKYVEKGLLYASKDLLKNIK